MNRPPLGTTLSRCFRLRCPNCGHGRLFAGWFRMHERCDGCGLKYERAPGYFLGSAYVNYGVTAIVLTLAYFVLHYGFGFTNRELALPLVLGLTAFALFFFRYARALWLGMDLRFDTTDAPTPTAREREDGEPGP